MIIGGRTRSDVISIAEYVIVYFVEALVVISATQWGGCVREELFVPYANC